MLLLLIYEILVDLALPIAADAATRRFRRHPRRRRHRCCRRRQWLGI